MLGFGCDLVITAERMHHICLGSTVAAVTLRAKHDIVVSEELI